MTSLFISLISIFVLLCLICAIHFHSYIFFVVLVYILCVAHSSKFYQFWISGNLSAVQNGACCGHCVYSYPLHVIVHSAIATVFMRHLILCMIRGWYRALVLFDEASRNSSFLISWNAYLVPMYCVTFLWNQIKHGRPREGSWILQVINPWLLEFTQEMVNKVAQRFLN